MDDDDDGEALLGRGQKAAKPQQKAATGPSGHPAFRSSPAPEDDSGAAQKPQSYADRGAQRANSTSAPSNEAKKSEEFVVLVGKNRGKPISQVSREDMEAFVGWANGQKEISRETAETRDAYQAFMMGSEVRQ